MTDDHRSLMLTGIVHDADRMDQILRLLVDAARVSDGALEPYPDRTDLAEAVAAVADMQRCDPEHPGIVWTGDPGPYFLDPTRLKTALLAFDESLRWWAGDGPVAVAAERDGDAVHLTASRAGTTIGLEDAEALFEARKPGTGGGSKIGLFVVRGVAQAQGGSAWASVAGDRLILHLRLPLAT